MCKTTATHIFVFISGSWWSKYLLVWTEVTCLIFTIWERYRVISEARAFTGQVFYIVGLIMRHGQESGSTA
jgi:hypothetical protein